MWREVEAVSVSGSEGRKFKSDQSGLEIILFQVEGPLVNAYITVATETRDDRGCPHTLEHLVFLGSEEYPYKGTVFVL
jgi:Zn-dependent M16 (insulinase) family peptidase